MNVDYVGNRLHAGIRTLQRGRRAIIIEIDNRAHEMGRDFVVPTVRRDDIESLKGMIERPFDTMVRVPVDAIERWKDGLGLRHSP